MPELIEVENYKQILLQLIQDCDAPEGLQPLCFERTSDILPKMRGGFLTLEDFKTIENCYLRDVERKGKLLRLILCSCSLYKHDKQIEDSRKEDGRTDQITEYVLYMHMGMSGLLSSPKNVPSLESQNQQIYPPSHTHLIIKLSEEAQVAFSDHRRFGGIGFGHDSYLGKQWSEIAQDALDPELSLDGLVGKTKIIKALLLDQKAVFSGVGNWIADEVLYQSRIHPNQTMLTSEEVELLKSRLQHILTTGNECLKNQQEFPKDWMFHRRWDKGKGTTIKDKHGHTVVFLTSGGRTSAIVPSLQKNQVRMPFSDSSGNGQSRKRRTDEFTYSSPVRSK